MLPFARRLPPRPRRWAAAVATLIAPQDEYLTWLDNLPDNLDSTDRDWPTSCTLSPSWISGSSTRSTRRAATAGTDGERNHLTPEPRTSALSETETSALSIDLLKGRLLPSRHRPIHPAIGERIVPVSTLTSDRKTVERPEQPMRNGWARLIGKK